MCILFDSIPPVLIYILHRNCAILVYFTWYFLPFWYIVHESLRRIAIIH